MMARSQRSREGLWPCPSMWYFLNTLCIGESPVQTWKWLSFPLEILACHPVLQLPNLLPISFADPIGPHLVVKLILLFLQLVHRVLRPVRQKPGSQHVYRTVVHKLSSLYRFTHQGSVSQKVASHFN